MTNLMRGTELVALQEETTTGELVAKIRELSDDPEGHGILLQHPVARHIDERAAFEAIVPHKDVDGVTMHLSFEDRRVAEIVRTAVMDALIMPVPGGVGPTTIADLLEQTVDAAWRELDA